MKRNWKVSMQFLQQKFTNILNVENSSRFVICGDIDIYKSIIMVLTLSPSDTNRRWRLSHFQWTTSRPAPQIVLLVHSIQVRFSTKYKYRKNWLFDSGTHSKWTTTPPMCESLSGLTKRGGSSLHWIRCRWCWLVITILMIYHYNKGWKDYNLKCLQAFPITKIPLNNIDANLQVTWTRIEKFYFEHFSVFAGSSQQVLDQSAQGRRHSNHAGSNKINRWKTISLLFNPKC